ncbi:hypothetical protein, partial [Stenotrophomonas maltophilia]|uniref:hypothetical protein n=1 Tax=Stenotrophomonas maltophilia TaxID=40324 RepID=UPI001F52DEF0
PRPRPPRRRARCLAASDHECGGGCRPAAGTTEAEAVDPPVVEPAAGRLCVITMVIGLPARGRHY